MLEMADMELNEPRHVMQALGTFFNVLLPPSWGWRIIREAADHRDVFGFELQTSPFRTRTEIC